MEIIPDGAVTTLGTQLSTVVGDNVVGILGVLFLGVAITFVMRWFRKSTKHIKA